MLNPAAVVGWAGGTPTGLGWVTVKRALEVLPVGVAAVMTHSPGAKS